MQPAWKLPFVEPSDRILYHNLWRKDGHEEVRYANLLPRLSRVDAFLTYYRSRVAFKAHRATQDLRYQMVFRLANARYRYALVNDFGQIARFRGSVIVDVDDPVFGEWEPRLLAQPNVVTYVVTDEDIARRYQNEGLEKPWHLIPHGIALDERDEAKRRQIAEARLPGVPVVGYISSWLLAGDDPGADNPLFNVDHLIDLWNAIHAQVPKARLWLFGRTRDRAHTRLASTPGVDLLGYLPPAELFAYVANFDVALYPRAEGQGAASMKIAEYLGSGVPVVAYDYDRMSSLEATEACLLAGSSREFVEGVVTLLRDDDRRARLAANAARVGRERSWEHLVRSYENIFEQYFPQFS